ALVFALLAPALGPEAAVGAFDRALAGALRHGASRATLEVFAAVTRLADPATLWGLGLGVCALLLLRRAWLPAVAWAVALAGHGLVNPALKAIFERPRPLFAHDLASGVEGFAFPSGHAAGAMAAYGM